MQTDNIFLKRSSELDIYLSDTTPTTLVKLYKKLEVKQKQKLLDEAAFLRRWRHPMLSKLLNYEFSGEGAVFEFEYIEGEPIDRYLVANPAKQSQLLGQLLRLCRWLAYNNIWLGDLKPEHLLVSMVNNQPRVRVIDTTPDRDWFTPPWAAPEQHYGHADYKSNLYTIGLIFADLYLPVQQVVQLLQNGQDLPLPEQSVLKNIWPQLLNALPQLRCADLEQLAPPGPQAMVLPQQANYDGFLEFHSLLCDAFYTRRIGFEQSFYLYAKYCLNLTLIAPQAQQNCRLGQQTRVRLADILEQEDFLWQDGWLQVKRNLTKLVTPAAADLPATIELARRSWDFDAFTRLWGMFIADVSAVAIAGTGNCLPLARLLAVAGQEDLAQDLFNQVYKTQLPVSDEAGLLWLHWQGLAMLYPRHIRPGLAMDEDLFTSLSPSMQKRVELLRQVLSRVLKQDWQALATLAGKAKQDDFIAFIIAAVLVFTANQSGFYLPLLKQAIAWQDFFLISNLLAWKQQQLQSLDLPEAEYALAIAALSGSKSALATVLTKLYPLMQNVGREELSAAFIKVYQHQLLAASLPVQLAQQVLEQTVTHLWQNGHYGQIVELVGAQSQATPGALAYCLACLALDSVYKLEPGLARMLRSMAVAIKKEYPQLLEQIMAFYLQEASKSEQNAFEKIFRLKLNQASHPLLLWRVLYKDNDCQAIINELKNVSEQPHLFAQAETYYHAGLCLKKRGEADFAQRCLRLARNLYNDCGLHKRAEQAASELTAFGSSTVNQPAPGLCLDDALQKLVKAPDLPTFVAALQTAAFAVSGFETCLPFVYDQAINNFSPLGNYNIDASYEGLLYSTRVLQNYRKNLTSLFMFDARNDKPSTSVHRLQIFKACCVPMLANGHLSGTLYLHTSNPQAQLSSQQQQRLELLAAVSGPLLNSLYGQQLLSRKQERQGEDFHGIVGTGTKVKAMIEQITRLAVFPYSVLIYGESGVGKELVAQALYKEGSYMGNMVSFNCSNLNPELFEANLFGHVKGAFTGADKPAPGKIELAQDGLIFFDEIGELPLPMQAKLLRVLENRTYYPVGSGKEKTTNARFIFATNQDLPALVKQGNFRADLYARIRQFQIDVPPLREHTEDLPALVKHFTGQFKQENPGISYQPVSQQTIRSWQHLPWPLNIRGLKYEVFRELVQQKPTVPDTDAAVFSVRLQDNLTHKEVTARYVAWLRDVLGTPARVIEFLSITAPTYYRLVNKAEEEQE